MINLELNLLSQGSVAPNSNVIFDTILKENGNISYDINNGVITFNEIGIYKIEWIISTQAVATNLGNILSFKTSNNDRIGNSPTNANQVFGTALLDISTLLTTASLVNESNTNIYYSSTSPLKATLIIEKVIENEGISIIPYSGSSINIANSGYNQGMYIASIGFANSSTPSYFANTFPNEISDYENIIAFSMPIDCSITNISGNYVGSGEISSDFVTISLALYEADANSSTYTLIPESITPLAPNISFDISTSFDVSGISTFSSPILTGKKIALILYSNATDPSSTTAGGTIHGNFSGSISIKT